MNTEEVVCNIQKDSLLLDLNELRKIYNNIRRINANLERKICRPRKKIDKIWLDYFSIVKKLRKIRINKRKHSKK